MQLKNFRKRPMASPSYSIVIAAKVGAGVSVKTIARKLKEMDHIRYVGSGNNGHWEIDDKPE